MTSSILVLGVRRSLFLLREGPPGIPQLIEICGRTTDPPVRPGYHGCLARLPASDTPSRASMVGQDLGEDSLWLWLSVEFGNVCLPRYDVAGAIIPIAANFLVAIRAGAYGENRRGSRELPFKSEAVTGFRWTTGTRFRKHYPEHSDLFRKEIPYH